MEPTKNLSDFSSSNTQSSGGSTGLSLANFLDEPKAKTGPVDLAGAIAQEGAEHIKPLIEAFYKQESGSGKNAGTSVDGAKGGMQVIPATFSRYAKPGESIDNPADNVRVGVRILKDLASKFGNDPAKIATGYFSGDGNVNQGSGQAWKEDRADGNGMRVSKYVSGILDKLGVTPKAQASAAPDITKAPKWSDIEGKPEFKALNDEQKAAAKQSYFDYWIAPHAGAKGDELRKQFMQPKESENGLLGGVLAAAKSGVGSVIDALTPDTQSLESPYKGERPANPDATLVPVSKETRAGFNSTWDAATPEQRKAMAEQPGWVGQLARERNSMYAQPGTQIGKRFDPRVESRRDTLIANGEDARFADTAARMGAQRGVVPGQEVASMATAKESGFDFDTKQAFQSGQTNGLNNPLVRGLAKGGLGFSKAITGYGEFLADAYGLDEAKKIVQSGSQWARGKEQAIGEAGTTLDRNFEGAISSIAQQLPLIVGGIRAGSEAVPLAGMALQSFGQEYSDGRAAGQDVAQATTRASIFAAFEVIGEKFGLRASMQAIKGAAHGMASDKLLGFLGEALKKEIPGELLTTTGQFATDKFAPGGVGLNPNATLDDYLQQVADTVIQTVMQGGVMAGGTTGVSAAVRHLQDNGQTQASAAADANLAQQQAMSKWATTGLGQSTSDPAGRVDPVGVPDSVHPSVTDAEQIVRELAADAGIPEETVLPTKVTPQPAPVVQDIAPMPADTGAETEAVSDQDVLNLANSRYQQLREKRDGATNVVAGEDGLVEQHGLGAGLSERERAEMAALEASRGDVGALRKFYGLDQQVEDLAEREARLEREAMQADDTPTTIPQNQDDDIPGFDSPANQEVLTNGPQATQAQQAEPAQEVRSQDQDQPVDRGTEARQEPSVSATGSPSLEADGLNQPQAPAKPKTEKEAKQRKAIERIAKGSAYFGSQEKAKDFITKNGIGDTHEAKKGKAGRWDIVAKENGSDTRTQAVYEASKAAAKALENGGTDADAMRAATDSLIESMDDAPGISVAQDAPAALEAAKQSKQDAPGTRYATDADRAGAERLEKLLEVFHAERNTPAGQARSDIRSVIEELRKPKTATSVEAVLQAAAQKLDRQHGPQADVVREVLEQIDQREAKDSQGGSQGEQAGGSRPTPAASEKFANNKIFTADKVAAARARMKAKLGQMNSGLDPELMIDGATLAGAYIEDGVRKYSDYTKAMVEDFGEKIRPYLRSFYEAVRHFPGLDTAGMTTAAEIDLMEQQGTAAHIKAAPGTEKAVGQNVKSQKANKERKAQTGRKLRDDWGVSYIDGYTSNQEFQGEETDYGLSGGVKDAFLKDAQAYLREVAKSLEQAGYVVPVDRSGKQIKKPVSVNESGPAVSGDVSMVMFHPHAKRGVYIHIGSTTLRGMVNTTKSGVAMMMRLTKEGDPYGGSENLWLPVDQTSDDLVNFITREVEKNSTNAGAIESTLAPVQNAVETKEADHAIPVQPKPVSEGTAGNPEPDAAAGNRDSKPVGTGLATGGEGSDRKQRVPTGVARTGEAGTGGVEPVSSDAPGQARDRARERIESESTGSNESSDDHVIDASEIGKGGLGKKFKENIAAIKLLKSLEADGRVATADERKALAKYVGWGAMKGPFDPENKAWAKQHAELKELLTDAEFKAARASTLDAHYTSPVAIGAIYDALTRIGFTGGRLLEPSVGSGNFFGLMPKGMRQASQLHGVELDSLTSRLVAALYPKAKIAKATGFEDFDVPSEFFDAVVGNPPFGNTPVVDKERSAYSGFSVHNYFLAKGIDKLRPGGVMAVVVSHNFLDAQDGRARKWIGERANLVAAARLPNTAFKENAGTEVVTDILIFQKKGEGVNSQDAAPWQSVVEQKNLNQKTGEQVAHKVNQLFASNPGFVLGTPSAAGSMYSSNEYTIEANGDLGKQLEKWASNLPGSLYTSIARKADTKALDMAIPDGIKVGSFYIAPTGRVMRRGADLLGDKTAFEWTPKSESQVARMKGMIELRDALRTQMRLERSPDATEAEIEANRGQLNKLYDDFVKKFKHVNSSTNRSIFLDDTEAHLIQGLEFDYDKGIGEAAAAKDGIDVRPPSAKKADIFERRVAFPPQDFMTVQTAKDALLASLNYRGKVDAEYIAGVYSKPFDEVVKELGDVVFDDPTTGVVTADEYLSGDVKTKLDEAKEAAKADSKYRRNVAALEAVIPKDKLPSEISVSIGASFVPGELYEEFVKHISGGTATAAYVKAMGQWLLAYTGGTDPALNTGRFGTSELSAQDLFQLTMLGRGAVVKKTYKNPDGSTTTVTLEKETEAAREKQNAIKAEWQKWIWQDTARADRLATIYNEKMNRLVVRKFDGSHLTFPGMNPAINLLAHQKNGVWRGLQSYQVLYDHVVGAGKTFEMATLAMEMRRLGIARKPLFVVPNHLTLQWRSEFTRLYPGANILAATPDDFSKNNRERMFAKIITGDWDAVVIGHSSLKKIGLPEKTEIGVMEEQIEELAAAIEEMKRSRGDKRITADMERIRKTLEAKMTEKLTAIGTRSKMVTFDELGVDAMFVDEMHEFKNLTYHTTMDRNPGMGNPAGSAKAFDMFVKTRWLFDTFGEKTPFITATGTPVSNSLVEMFNMQRYMQYPLLKREGLNVFDAWAKQFGNVENVYEVAPSGSGYRQSTRFAKFTNLPGLMSLYNSFADTITLDDLKAQEEEQGKRFPVPKIQGGRPTLIVAKRSPAVAELMGVPKAETDEHGNITFEIPVNEAMETEIKRAEKGDKFIASVKVKGADGAIRDVHLGQFDTEQDARLKIVEKALTPVVTVNPESILGRFANLRELTKQSKGKVNALSLTGEANKAGLDYRLVNPSAPDFEGSKINLAVGRMMEIYKKWAKDLGTQLVFCDLSIPLSARASYSSDSRKLYVRDDVGAVVLKRGTMHTVEGHEDLPFFVLTRGEKELRRFDVYDAATGLRLLSDYRAKADAVAAAGEAISDDAKREKLISARESGREISQAEVDDYNNENDIEVEDAGAFFTREDIAGMSGSAKFSVYDDIKAKLMAKGVPEREIAFIHDYSSPTAKEKLFKAVKAGEVRFLLGSTPKMGAGTNVQDRLVGLHHIDAPWRPSDLEQREGRIIRRGNKLYERDPDNFEVFIGRYATEQTYDTRRWQILEHKARGIEQLRNYDGSTNEIDDIDGEAANSADMKAAASGDPMILEETKLRNDVRRLEQLQSSHADEVLAMARKATYADEYVKKWGPKEIAEISELIASTNGHPLDKDGFAPISVEGRNRSTTKEAAQKDLASAFESVRSNMRQSVDIVYRGITFRMELFAGGQVILNTPTGNIGSWPITDSFSASGALQRLKNYVDRLPGLIDNANTKVEKAKNDAKALREQAGKPFANAEQLEKAREDHKKVQRALMAKGPAVPDSQKPMLKKGIESQKVALKKAGFGEALDEFFGSGNEIKFNTQDGQDEYNRPHEKAEVHTQQRTERTARNMRSFQAGVLRDLSRNGHHLRDDVTYFVPVAVPQAREISEIARAFGTEIQWFELNEGLTANERRHLGKYIGANLGGIQYIKASGVDRPHLAVLGHELAHELKKKHPDLYNQFVEAVNAFIKPGAYPKFLNEGVAKNSSDPREEFSGEVLSDLFMERKFWQSMGERSPTLLQKIADLVLALAEKLKQTVGYTKRSAPYLSDFQKVMDIAEDVMRQFASRVEKATQNDEIRFATANSTGKLMEFARKAQNNLIHFFGNQNLDTFNWYDKSIATQYHKALKDPHFGKVYQLLLGMQNHVSMAAVRAAQLAPGVLPRVDDAKTAVKELFSVKSREALDKASMAIFSGTLAGNSVLEGVVWSPAQLRANFQMDETAIALYYQARAAIDSSLDEVAAAEAYSMANKIVPKSLRADIIERPEDASKLISDEINAQIKTMGVAIAAAKKAGDNQMQAELSATRDSYKSTLRQIEAIFTKALNLKNAGYAPLMRFGKYTVEVQPVDPQTGLVERDEDGKPMTIYFGRFETQADARRVQADMDEHYKNRDDIRVSAGSYNDSKHEIYSGVTPETLELFADAIGAGTAADEYIRLVKSDRSALKRQLERKGTPGFSTDVSRVLSNFITSNARHAAQQFYMQAINNAVKYIPKEKGDVQKEAQKLRNFVIDPKDAGAIGSSLMFAWFLGGSPAAAAVNATQPLMVTLPYLSQFVSPEKAAAELTKATPAAMGKAEIADADLRDALRRASLEGAVDAQEIFHLYSLGSRQLALGTKSQAALTLWGSMFSAVEGLNRRLTFIAAWNIAKQQGNKSPYAFAIRAVNSTQGIYNKVNRPNFARSSVGRLVFTYKGYAFMVMELMTRMWKSGPNGKRGVAIMLAMLLLASGEEGLPGAKALDDLIDSIGQLMGYDTNMRRFKRRHAYEILGKAFGDAFLYGASSHMPLDFGGRLGLGSMIPGTDLLKISSANQKGKAIGEIVGPSAGMAQQVGDAIEAAGEGNFGQAMQNLAPKAVKDVLAAASMATKGYSTDAVGRKVVDVGLSDAAVKAVGFQPTVIAQEHRKTMPIQQDIALQQKTEASIVANWAQGIVNKDENMVDQARAKMEKWNKDNPDSAIAISPSQIKSRVKMLVSDKENRTLHKAPKEMRGRVGLDLADD